MKKYINFFLIIIGIIILLTIIDLTFIFTKSRPVFAIKDKNGYVYRGLFYDTYNCPEYSIAQIKPKGAKLACSILNITIDKESTNQPTKLENVDIRISDISLTGTTIVITDNNKNPYKYGLDYKIEKQVNDKWYELTTLIDNEVVISYGYLPDENNEVIFEINWEDTYGKLNPGNYRILKKVKDKYIAVEFGIEKTS